MGWMKGDPSLLPVKAKIIFETLQAQKVGFGNFTSEKD
jgi:hypothetical protein